MPSFIDKIRSTALRLVKLDRVLDEVKINQGRILSKLNLNDDKCSIQNSGFKVFSQWDEDGIIQFLVHNLKIENRTFIEFGVEDFFEANCRFLLMKDRWEGYVIDGSPSNINRLRSSYLYWQYPIAAKNVFINKDNIAELLEKSGFSRNLGILSIDIDGVDYWILDALEEWSPSIVIVEYNSVFGSKAKVSVPYSPDFNRTKAHSSNLYWGASLSAFDHLLRKRGYSLITVNSAGSNAFFVKSELCNKAVFGAEVSDCFKNSNFKESRDPDGNLSYLRESERLRIIENLSVVEVDTGNEIFLRDIK